MKIYIALFRGINVGGRNILPMKELVKLLIEIGCQDVKTYIQSGNAIFRTSSDEPDKLNKKISKVFQSIEYASISGFEVNGVAIKKFQYMKLSKNNNPVVSSRLK
jgi:uncharacterized protein (DUF1697 family)